MKYQDGKQHKGETIVVSQQHTADMVVGWLTELTKEVAKKVIPSNLMNDEIQYYVNPTGKFEVGGPAGDTGLTGRKIIVDTYGGRGAHGGGAFFQNIKNASETSPNISVVTIFAHFEQNSKTIQYMTSRKNVFW